MRSLPDMLERIRQEAAKIFAREKTLIPTFIGVRADDSELVLDADDAGVPDDLGRQPGDPTGEGCHVSPTPEAKNAVQDYVRARFAAAGVKLYGLAFECWVVQRANTGASFPDFGRAGISREPDRYEALWFSAEDRTTRVCARQSIIRPVGREPFLDDDFELLKDYQDHGGRFLGLLDPPKPRAAPRLPGLPDRAAESLADRLDRLDPIARRLLLDAALAEAKKRGML